MHSVWASCESLRLASTLQPSRRNDVLLPERMVHSAHDLFATSLAYFWCDVIWIAVQRARGRAPHLWLGRLAHHAVQTAANAPVLLSAGRQRRIMSAYLGLAYTAELSTIFLRLSRLLPRLRRRARLDGALLRWLDCQNRRALLATFVVFRLVNFPICGRLIARNRAELPRAVVRTHASFATLAYVLNVGWFVRLARRRGSQSAG